MHQAQGAKKDSLDEISPEEMLEGMHARGFTDMTLAEVKAIMGVDNPTQFYRIIGSEERDALRRGEEIVGQRYEGANSNAIDITSNPNYDRIQRRGKFLVTFKENPKLKLYDDGGKV